METWESVQTVNSCKCALLEQWAPGLTIATTCINYFLGCYCISYYYYYCIQSSCLEKKKENRQPRGKSCCLFSFSVASFIVAFGLVFASLLTFGAYAYNKNIGCESGSCQICDGKRGSERCISLLVCGSVATFLLVIHILWIWNS